MKRVMLESPYKGNVEENKRYAMRCMKDSILLGEAPFLSHLLYPLVLDDNRPLEREYGMACGHAWLIVSSLVAVYTDYGLSSGMRERIEIAQTMGMLITYRSIGKNNNGD